MKWNLQSLFLSFVLIFLAACNSDTTPEPNDNAAPNTPGVQNVNGNVPDSANSINLNNSQRVDSSLLKDSLDKGKARQ